MFPNSCTVVYLPLEEEGYFSNYQSYSIYLKDSAPISRNEFMQKMLEKGIATRRGIMTSHRETAYKYLNVSDLTVTEKTADQSVLLPLYIPMDAEDQDYVIQNIKEILG